MAQVTARTERTIDAPAERVRAALSDYEMRITLATVISSWDLESTGEDQDVRHNIGSGPKHGVPIRVHGRRQGSYARSQHARA